MGAARQLVIFVKAPRLGRVKTRLARGIGPVAAWSFYRRASQTVIRRLAGDRRWRTSLAVTPDAAVARGCAIWPGDIPRLAQGDGDLGVRMARCMRALGPGPVVIVGTDIPDLRGDHVARAFRALRRADAVFGPCPDGGYWLVGLNPRALSRNLFRDVRWSTPHALADSRATLKPGARVAMLECLHDIDTAQDLATWQSTR